MTFDRDVKEMSPSEAKRELMRVRNLIRTHKKKEGNARCWHNDETLYKNTLPEGSVEAGKMSLPEPVLLQNCKAYIRRQQCSGNLCGKGRVSK